ncbi:MAG: M3 family oligoendopeptidase [Candidatus Woesearchaeota archaeon]
MNMSQKNKSQRQTRPQHQKTIINKKNKKSISNKKIIIDKSKPMIRGAVWNLEEIRQGKRAEEWLALVTKDVEAFVLERRNLTPTITPKKLFELISLKERIAVNFYRVQAYDELKFYEDTGNSDALAQINYLKQYGADIDNKTLFFSLWFMGIDEENVQRLVNAPELKPYKHYLEQVRINAPYTKSEEIERIINLIGMTGGGAFSEIYQIITNNYTFELGGKKIGKEEITSLFRSPNPKIREEAYTKILSRYHDERVVLTEIYKNVTLDWHNEEIKVRGYKTPMSVRNQSNDVNDAMVTTLLKVIRKNVKIFAEYFKLKYTMNIKAKQKYPYSRFHLYAPYPIQLSKKYDYAASVRITLDTYKSFDERFFTIAKKIFDAKHVHSHPAQKKRSGAFCFNTPTGTLPYILLNHTDELRDVFTMMHEFGHGIHMTLSQKQKDLIQHASLPMSETASTFAEMLLANRMLKESTDSNEKKYILTSLLDNQYATIGRQAYFTLFEDYAHHHIIGQLTIEDLDAYYCDLLKEQFPGMDIPILFQNEWRYIPHIYESPFYCYAYAWGNLLVLALFEQYRKEGKKFVEKYITFLETGAAKSGYDMMQALGVDPTSEAFWQSGFDLIKEEIDELKKLSK